MAATKPIFFFMASQGNPISDLDETLAELGTSILL
jgi:hypothetical protein